MREGFNEGATTLCDTFNHGRRSLARPAAILSKRYCVYRYWVHSQAENKMLTASQQPHTSVTGFSLAHMSITMSGINKGVNLALSREQSPRTSQRRSAHQQKELIVGIIYIRLMAHVCSTETRTISSVWRESSKRYLQKAPETGK